MLRFFQVWWSRSYNRPLKDPVLQEYTLEELAYEYFTVSEHSSMLEESTEYENDKIEQEQIDDAMAWANEEEAKELEEDEQAHVEEPDPTKDPKNIEWMEEQMRLAKEQYGDTFGEDISENFDE